jgi:hypothetical protein
VEQNLELMEQKHMCKKEYLYLTNYKQKIMMRNKGTILKQMKKLESWKI